MPARRGFDDRDHLTLRCAGAPEEGETQCAGGVRSDHFDESVACTLRARPPERRIVDGSEAIGSCGALVASTVSQAGDSPEAEAAADLRDRLVHPARITFGSLGNRFISVVREERERRRRGHIQNIDHLFYIKGWIHPVINDLCAIIERCGITDRDRKQLRR